MPVIDLTHPIQSNISVYPGDEAPVITTLTSIARDGYQSSRLTLSTHTGTHIDAPAHLLPDTRTLDQFPIDRFLGRAQVIDCRGLRGEISRHHLEPLLVRPGADFILLLTGWDQYWMQDAYLSGFPVLSAEAARWLASFDLKGIGLDALSIDHADSSQLPNHRCFLSQDILILENLTNLAALAGKECQLYCLPLLISGADGAPARVIASLP